MDRQVGTQNQSVQDVQLATDNIFRSQSAFQLAARMADAFSKSTIVPKDYQGSAANCLIALEIANRMGTSPMMVMQNLYIVNGRPAWSSQFIIGMINNSKKFKTELQYDLTGSGDSLACYAYAYDSHGRKVVGPTITMQMAKDEGWLSKNGSKWKTMPEVMIRYRAASFFGRLNCPDMIMGIYSADEVIDLPEHQFQYAESVQKEILSNCGQESHSLPGNPSSSKQATQAPPIDASQHTEHPGDAEGSADTANNISADEIEGNGDPEQQALAYETTTDNSKGNEPPATGSELGSREMNVCATCGAMITDAESRYSVKTFGEPLCRKHQQESRKTKSSSGSGGYYR